MRFAAVLAAVVALWAAQPAQAAVAVRDPIIYTGELTSNSGWVGIVSGYREWVSVRFSRPLTEFKGIFAWYSDLSNSYCDETLTDQSCISPIADGGGYDGLTQFNSISYRAHYIKPIEGWFLGTYIVDGALVGDGLQFTYKHDYATPVSYTITFSDRLSDLSDGVPEPSTWALMILGFGLVGGALRRRGHITLPA